MPHRVTLPNGSAADVTITAATDAHIGWTPYAVLFFTITGRSSQRFAYDESAFTWQYATGPDPWHPDNSVVTGVDWQGYASFAPPLKTGTVRSGQTVTGTVPFWVGSAGGSLLVSEYASTQFGDPEAQWLITNPAHP